MSACATPKRTSADGGNRDLALPSTEDPIDFAEPSSVDLRASRDLSTATGDLAGGVVDLGGGGGVDLAGGAIDMAPMCTPPVAGSPCDTFPQCGCSGGQNCTVSNNTTGATSCVAAGTTNNYSGCSTTASVCKVGAACVGGVCAPFCETNADCPGNYRQCVQVVSGSTNIPGFKVCSQTCDPTNPQLDDTEYDPCGPGINCYPATNRASFCVGPTTAGGTQFAECGVGGAADDTLCAPGYICLDDFYALSGYSCQKFCRVGSNCALGAAPYCNALYVGTTPVYAGARQIGACYDEQL